MKFGFTCHTCRIQLKTVFDGSLATLASRSPTRRKWTSVVKHDAQRPPNSPSCPIRQQHRSMISLRSQEQKKKYEFPGLQRRSASLTKPPGPILLKPDDLFHPFSKSPIPEIRRRAALMKTNAYCPHPSHHQTRLPTEFDRSRTNSVEASLPPAYVNFECPDCGIPVYCCEDHWMNAFANHIQICDTLRQINEDDHDIRSNRDFTEFDYPEPYLEEALVNMMNWDTYLYTRQYKAINEERSLRQVTKLLTYPMTIGSVIHEFSPYSIKRGGRLTTEGLKSLSGK